MMTSERPPVSNAGRNVSVESFPYVVDDRYYFRRMKEILQDGLLPKPTLPVQQDQLSGHVFIGNQRNADDLPGLRSAGIDHVLSCAASRRSTESPYDAESGIVDYFLIPAEDREDFDITRYFDAAFLFLDRVKRRRGRALVHCNMGVNRSGAIVAAYLMVDECRNLLDVIAYLKSKRRLVLSNKGFRIQLIQFARSRGLLDPVVDTVTRISYMDERRRAKSEENDERRRRTKTPPAVKSEDRASFRPALRDTKHEQKNENEAGVVCGERDAGNANGKYKQRDEVKPRNSNNDMAVNGIIDASHLRPIGDDNNTRISKVSIKPVTGNVDVSPRKYSSSFQYWPKIDTPPPPMPSKVTGNGEVRQPGAKTEPGITVVRRRRYVRTRSDSRAGVDGDSENQASATRSEPHKLLSTIFCTLRAKPKRDAEVSKQSYIVDGLQRLQMEGTTNSTTYHSRDTAPRFSLGNPSVPDEVPVNFRPRCPSGTLTRTRNTGGGGGGGGNVEKVSSGFLVLLGKKVVHAKSSSQWNLSAIDRETEPLFSKESGRAGNFTGPRKRLSELSGIGTPWRSVEKISESNVYLIRKDFF